MKNYSSNGFTLIELSIVLVIVALVIGGVVAGKEMILTAQINRTISGFSEYQTAINTYKQKYNCLPGDCANSTRFWGNHSSGGGSICIGRNTPEINAWIAADFQEGTCNGDGNGRMNATEGSVAWQQLANAKLIKGSYNGVPTFGYHSAGDIAGGTRWPLAPIPAYNANLPLTYTLNGNIRHPTNAYYLPLSNADLGNLMASTHYITLGSPSMDGSDWVRDGLTQDMARILDTKMDDGNSFTGRITGKRRDCSPSTTGLYNNTDCVISLMNAY